MEKKDIELIAVTRSLAGAVKAVLDTPILMEEGNVTRELKDVYEQTKEMLPVFRKNVDETKRL